MIIGRKREKELLERAYNATEAQFITVYGRRRVGKTFLIREFFSAKDCLFLHVTGKQDGLLKDQLTVFMRALSRTFYHGAALEVPTSWDKAFDHLTQLIKKSDKKVVIFFDELPWLASRRSGLMGEFTEYWNSVWAGMGQVRVVACGSSASWILEKIIYNKGGLHNRTTLEINLLPFKLWEARDFLYSKGITLSDNHIVSLYMALGGIPYYLNYVLPGRTAQQAIQELFFDEHAPLQSEYTKLFESLFDGAHSYTEIIEYLAQQKQGVQRGSLEKGLKSITGGSQLTDKLKALTDAGFIKAYHPWGKTVGSYYKVIDEFCLFSIRWIKGYTGTTFDQNYWVMQSQKPAYHAWAGHAFEALCVKHIHQIIRALGIATAQTIGSWQYKPTSKHEYGAQIDLVIERIDDAITLCEIKYTDQPFIITKSYAEGLARKVATFKKQTNTTKHIFTSMVSAHGLKKNLYAQELIQSVVTLEDLFKP